MEWPSKRIAPGGIFHVPKVKYDPETKDFLKLLLNESKLSIAQRRNKSNCNVERPKQKLPKILIRPGSPRRRSLETILSSGAYQREKFTPKVPIVNRETLKIRLQDSMAYGKDAKNVDRNDRKIEKTETKETNRFDELVKEIQERENWLEEMAKIGEDHMYRDLIQEQIKEKIREMETLKPLKQ